VTIAPSFNSDNEWDISVGTVRKDSASYYP
jgi:hypothetical protein